MNSVALADDGGRKQDTLKYIETVHHYLAHEAYQLLAIQHPEIQSTQMANHVGYWETAGPFTTGKIAAGVWREDAEDLVYGYASPFGWTVTTTHFWDADAGDDSMWDIEIPLAPTVENAYQKSRVFIYGSDVWQNRTIFIPRPSHWPEFEIYNTLGWYMSYESLFDLYRTGKYYWEGYVDEAGDVHTGFHYGPFYMSQESRHSFVWEILGHVCHLIADMSVPAHVHNDAHYEEGGDSYDNGRSLEYVQQWTASSVLQGGGGLIDISWKYDPLRYVFFTMNQLADHFPSDERAGDNSFDPQFGTDTYTELRDTIANLGPPPVFTNFDQIASTVIPMNIRLTASLLYWFAVETELPHSITLNAPTYWETGSGATYKVNGSNVGGSWQGSVDPNVPVAVEAVPPSGWSFVEWSDSGPDKYANPRVLTRNANMTVSAMFKKRMTSTIASATGPTFQRKLTRDVDGVVHVVYPTNGTLWYTKTSDLGASWSNEARISGNGYAETPSSASSSLYCSDLFTAWQETDAGAVRHLYLRRQFENQFAYVDELDNTTTVPDMQPSVGLSADGLLVLVMYKKVFAGSSRLFYRFSSDAGETFDGPTPLTVGTPITWDYPSIAWNEQGGRFIVSCVAPGGYLNYLTFDSETWSSGSVACPTGLAGCTQVAVDGAGREYFSWTATGMWDELAGFVKSRNLAGSWSPTTEINTDLEPPLQTTTVTGISSQNGGGALICLDQMVELTFKSINGTSWVGAMGANWPWYWGASSVNMVDRNPVASVASVLTTNTSAPYQVRFETRNFSSEGFQKANQETDDLSSPPRTLHAELTRARAIIYHDTVSHGSLEFLLNEVRALTGDTLQYLEFLQSGDWLSTSTFVPSGETILEGDIYIRSRNWPARFSYSFGIENSVGDSPLLVELAGGDVCVAGGDTVIVKNIRSRLPILSLEAVLSTRISGIPTEGILVEQREVIVASDSSDGKNKHYIAASTEPTMPSVNQLFDAYPNPFNPTTTIRYSTASDGLVSLKVFDILGREVVSLVDGFRKAGKHEAVWDARGRASGTYFLRFTISNIDGAAYFAKSGKLLLLR